MGRGLPNLKKSGISKGISLCLSMSSFDLTPQLQEPPHGVATDSTEHLHLTDNLVTLQEDFKKEMREEDNTVSWCGPAQLTDD